MTRSLFEATYPNITSWVNGGGWIEVGEAEYVNSFVRAFDEGGMIWEGQQSYRTVDQALQDLDAGIKAWVEEHGM